MPLWSDGEALAREFRPMTMQLRVQRFAALVEGYAVRSRDRDRLADAVLAAMRGHASDIERLAAGGDAAFVALAASGRPGAATRMRAVKTTVSHR